MSGTIPFQREHWPEPPRRHQAIALAAVLIVLAFVTLF